MGTVALSGFAAAHPGRVTELVLLGPARAQDPQAREATRTRAHTVREGGMSAVATLNDAAAFGYRRELECAVGGDAASAS
ncbi:hypothetical protein [Streptomyces shenzhenensis]|uniref:hypothetical protein n=1 Tax=Streptomyces shenzhenensis TaxID=943815 RepID=UPI001C7F98B5|nr:hypothetical protein [Streptomyces shenzhenensis]